MVRAADQYPLFDVPQQLPSGFLYRPEFITPTEEAKLLAVFDALPFVNAPQGEYVAKRRIVHFGWSYDYERERLIPGEPLPEFLQPLARKIAKWLDIPVACIAEALVTEYSPGTPLGWHCDNEKFESIVGISLAGWCQLRLRPIKSKSPSHQATGKRNPAEVATLTIEPRSAYLMQRESRWDYQHSVAAVQTLRYSITFRTLTLEQLPGISSTR